MKVIFSTLNADEIINKYKDKNYSLVSDLNNNEVIKDNKTYKIYTFEKKIPYFLNRMIYGIKAIYSIITSTSFSSEKAKENWSKAWEGKKIIQVYLSTPFTPLSKPIEAEDKKEIVFSREEALEIYKFIEDLSFKYNNKKSMSCFWPYQKEEKIAEASQGYLLNKMLKFNSQEYINYPSDVREMHAVQNRWQELEKNGMIAPPIKEEGILFLSLNLSSLSKPSQGLDYKDLFNEKSSRVAQNLSVMIKNWKENTNAEEAFTRSELAFILKISLADLNEFCLYLQILKNPISSALINYYFNAIEELLNTDNIYSDKNVNFEFFKNLENVQLLAFSSERFPALDYKQEWKLQDLSLYLAIEETSLKNSLEYLEIKTVNDVYLTSNLLPHLKELFEMNKNHRTQIDSLRFLTKGTQTAYEK